MGYCDFANINKNYKEYHDKEWGVPLFDDKLLFEALSLECLQCGLSFLTILLKRDIFRKSFCNFDFEKVAKFKEQDIEKILNTEGMIKLPRKIEAIINNAKCFKEIVKEEGSFSMYFWSYSNNKIINYIGHERGKIPVCNALSKKIANDLKKRGFKFVGAVTIYSFLQAVGMINDHSKDCPCYDKINKKYEVVRKKAEGEVF
ncbi:MAG: DNA-3-methyladenine glycosylase I [Bdellovibrionota bacterium]|nr:DNA-3-methyladenine glycosylase I [Pseudomonadota bacterium]MDY6090198.1 DNA-3-methyladenine glycosylase I [Bdellovibrionota bacterium]